MKAKNVFDKSLFAQEQRLLSLCSIRESIKEFNENMQNNTFSTDLHI